ncbi:MAG: phosphoserine transaminase [Deltaproteobacteria bacterium]|nr:phosphoserine transaminase [Deltaproteobacteria bacterium]
MKPNRLPARPEFSSGPCAKRPGWTLDALSKAFLGRSHRHKTGKARLAEVIDRSRALLHMPEDWVLAIVPASDTGAVEMAMWSMLGARGVDLFAWESFGSGWITDVTKQLKLADARTFVAEYGALPDFSVVDGSRDVVFTWNGTTGGARVPNADFVPLEREGVVICDATSAAFAMRLDWARLDVVTWSWQKVLGGEAAHGMLALSPRAVARLESFTPARPLPKIFRMTKGGKLNGDLFRGSTINTPSMLAVEDALDGLRWAESIGGLDALVARTEANLSTVAAWIDGNPRYRFLAPEPAQRSSTSICLVFADPAVVSTSADEQRALQKKIVALLEQNGAGYDLGAYRDAPPGLRIWGGSTVEQQDIEALLPWLDWAHDQALGR